MSTLVTILHVAVCLFLMLTVLLQSGKGGGVGAAFGAGGSQTVFGGSGGGNFLRRLTVACAAIFMLTSITLAYLASSTGSDSLRKYAEQQRALRDSIQQTRQEALKDDGQGTTLEQPGTAPEGTTPEGTTPEGTAPAAGEGAAPGAEGTEVPPAGEGTAPAGEGTAPAGDTPAANPGATQDPAAPAAAPAGTPAPATGEAAPATGTPNP